MPNPVVCPGCLASHDVPAGALPPVRCGTCGEPLPTPLEQLPLAEPVAPRPHRRPARPRGDGTSGPLVLILCLAGVGAVGVLGLIALLVGMFVFVAGDSAPAGPVVVAPSQPDPVADPVPTPPDPLAAPVPPFREPVIPFRPGTQTRVRQVRAVPAPGNVVQLAYVPGRDLVFARNSGSALWVVDARTGRAVRQAPRHQFADLSPSPDGAAVFATDFLSEGDNSFVHRYDLAGRGWEVRGAPKVAYRIEAVDGYRVLLLEEDQWVDLTLNRWDPAGAGMAELARTHAGRGGDIAYDPRTGRVFHGASGSSVSAVTVWRVAGAGWGPAESGGVGENANAAVVPVTLSAGGQRLYYGTAQLEALDVTRKFRPFPEPVVAASRDLAFGAAVPQPGEGTPVCSYYDARTGARLGTLGAVAAVTVSPDGMSVWAFDPATNELKQFALEGDR